MKQVVSVLGDAVELDHVEATPMYLHQESGASSLDAAGEFE